MSLKVRVADVVLIVLLVGLSFVPLLFFRGGSDAASAEVCVNGKTVYVLPLDRDADVSVDGVARVEVRDGGVRVYDSTCPDHLCERMGVIRTSGNAIVCLPGRLTVRITGGEGVDAVAG